MDTEEQSNKVDSIWRHAPVTLKYVQNASRTRGRRDSVGSYKYPGHVSNRRTGPRGKYFKRNLSLSKISEENFDNMSKVDNNNEVNANEIRRKYSSEPGLGGRAS